MELFLKFNLGPLHLLNNSSVDEVLKKEPVSFIRKETRSELLSSKDVRITAAVHTYQKKKEVKSKLPAEFWSKDFITKEQLLCL